MSLYVYISEKCEEEARSYHLEEHLYQLKNRVEQEQNLSQFEVFEYPYRVKKRLGYNYRLLTRLCYVEIQQKKYQVLVFLKLYNRGDKDYSLLYINAKARGDFIYQQQNIDPYLQHYVQQRLTQQHVQVQYEFNDQDLLYLQHSRINVLNLQQQLAEYYVESPAWRYQVRPILRAQELSNCYQYLLDAFDLQQSTTFQIQQHQVAFLKQDENYQLSVKNELIHTQNDLQIEKIEKYAQRIPLDLLLDQAHWLLAEQLDLPFCLNAFQQNCIDLLFHQHQDYPVLINAGKNVGKTTLLTLLYLHFIQQNYVTDNVLPCLFLVSSHEVIYIRQQIQHYVELQQQWKKLPFAFSDHELSHLLSRSCISLNDLIQQQLSPKHAEKFQDDLYMSEIRFNRLWNKAFYEHEEAKKLYTASLCWYVIHYLIKGYSLDQEHEHSAQVMAQLSMISPEIFQKIEEQVWKAWYQPLCETYGYWDDQDLILEAYDADIHLPNYSALLCDQSQNLTRNATQFILQSSIWLKKPIELHIYDAPFIFMGQHSASYPTSLLTWYREINHVLQQNIQVGKKSLSATIRDYSEDDLRESNLQQNSHNLCDLDLHLQQKRQALYILKSKINLIYHVDDVADVEILFVSTKNESTIKQLLIQAENAFILNCLVGKQNSYLKSNPPFSQIFKLLTEQQIQQPSYCLNHLPKKMHRVVLCGFYHHSFELLQKSQLEQLRFSERYHIDYRLNLLQQACQQGLQQIVILGDDGEFDVWHSLFSAHQRGKILNPFQFRRAELHDFTSDTQQQDKVFAQLEQQEKLAVAKQDSVYLRTLAQQYFELKEFKKYLQLSIQASDFEQNYEEYFLFCQNDEQKEAMVQLLWTQQKPHLLLKYQKYFPVSLVGNVHALLLANERVFRQDYSTDFLNVVQQYQQQHAQALWQDFWQILLEKILTAFMTTADTVRQNWTTIFQALKLLEQLNFPVPVQFMAYCAYQRQDPQTARDLWQKAKALGNIQEFPKEYYTLNLTTAEDVPARLSCLIALGQTEQLMNELNQLNLNELQTEYWEQILEYLYEEDELKPILKQLIPKIYSQDVLEKLYRFCKNHTSDKFALRIQRFKTLQACLNSDWEIVQERLAHYIPIQNEKVAIQKLLLNFGNVSKARTRNKKNTSIPFSEELIEILYALNLNSNIYVPQNNEDFKNYAENEQITAIFDAIRKNFALANDQQDIVWKINFSAIRSLCYLLEKSPNPYDGLQIYQNMIDRKQKDNLFDFSVSRLFTLIQRLKFIDHLDEAVQKKLGQLEVEHKKLFQSQQLFDIDLSFDLPVIKAQDEIVKSILALSNQENSEIQKLEREEALEIAALEQAEKEAEIQAQNRQDAELKHLFDLAEQQKQQQEEEEKRLQLEQQHFIENTKENENNEGRETIEHVEIENIAQICVNVKDEEKHEETQQCLNDLVLVDEVKAMPESEECILEPVHIDDISLQQNPEEKSAPHMETIETELASEQVSKSINNPVHETEQHDVIQRVASVLSQPMNTTNKLQSRKAITEFEFFGARIFVSRIHQRINIEDIETGERWSLHLKTGKIQSDWEFSIKDQHYHLAELRLVVVVTAQYIQLQQLNHGIEMSISL